MAKLIASVEGVVAYSSLAVYDADLELPYNYWTNRHVEQGFSWRVGSVSFGTINSLGIQVEVWLAETAELLPQTQRAIQVPFFVPPSGRIAVSDIVSEDTVIELPSGSYLLLFENWFRYDIPASEQNEEFGPEDTRCRLSFIPCSSRQPQILRETGGVAEGGSLSPTYPLLMEAKAA